MILDELFYYVDEFCEKFMPEWEKHLLTNGERKRNRPTSLCMSEIITILILFHQSHYRNFKAFYLLYVKKHLHSEFPRLVSYNRFVELIPRAFTPMCAYLQSRQKLSKGVAFIDSTPIVVCNMKRMASHKVFKGLARLGKSTKGWFYGFKLHLVCNHKGDLVSCRITAGNVDDRKPVPAMAKIITGKMYGDKGYISKKLFAELLEHKLQLVTGIKKTMKNKLLAIFDKIMLRKRAIIESINNQLKNVFQIEHTRHRSIINGFLNIIAALIAFTHHENKPKVAELNDSDIKLMENLMSA